ncbi:hypothetical protein ACFX1X_032947 [Malus domestica]
MQAEYIAVFEAKQKALWIKDLVSLMGIVDSISRPIVIHCDNKAAVFISKNNKQSSANRLMDIKYRSVRDDVKSGLVVIEHIDTGSMIADPLTKPLPVAVFKQHVAKMGVLESFDSVTMWE